MELIGRIPVDSGQVMVIDPCYAWEDNYRPGGEPTGLPYDEACRATLSPQRYGYISGIVGPQSGIATSTYYGDGTYPVYAEKDSNGRIKRLIIDFDPEGDEDDEDDEDYWGDEGEDFVDERLL